MKRLINTCMGCMLLIGAYAANEPYATRNIADSLLKGAHMVKRTEQIQFDITSTRQSTLHYKYALTVLNENGDPYAELTEFYDKLREVVSIEGNLYDKEGRLIRKLKSKEIQDQSALSDINLIDDSRKKVHNFYHKSYPYTVEYEVVVRYNNTFMIPSWFPQEYEHLAVEQSSFTISMPSDYTIRYRMHHYKGEPLQSTGKSRKVYSWRAGGMVAVEREFASPRWHEMTTVVSMAPTEFEIEGYKGNMTTWKDFGLFFTT